MKDILKSNAEFAKNLWLEFSPQRLVAMPAIIGMVMFIVVSMSSEEEKMKSVNIAALVGFVLIGMLWGVKTSAESILEEYNEKTWDWQKMSILGPWKLTIGKLFGSTIYNWYGAGICWIIYMLSVDGINVGNKYMIGLFLIIITITLHALMQILALQLIRKADGRSKVKSNQNYILGVILVSYFMGAISLSEIGTQWYSLAIDGSIMMLITGVFYGSWVVAGLYRTIRAELQYSDAPVWWLIFIASNIVFQFGFFIKPEFKGTLGIATCLTFVFFELLFVGYLLALSEPKDIVNFRSLLNSWKQNKQEQLFKNMPLWMVTFPIAFVIGFLAVLFFILSIDNLTSDISVIPSLSNLPDSVSLVLILALIAVFGFVIRDLGILLLLNFSTRSKRADAAMLLYLIILYGLFPVITINTGISVMFFPNITVNSFAMAFFPLVEATVVVLMVINQWKKINRL